MFVKDCEPKTFCDCKEDTKYFLKRNLLSELVTDYQKEQARKNLGLDLLGNTISYIFEYIIAEESRLRFKYIDTIDIDSVSVKYQGDIDIDYTVIDDEYIVTYPKESNFYNFKIETVYVENNDSKVDITYKLTANKIAAITNLRIDNNNLVIDYLYYDDKGNLQTGKFELDINYNKVSHIPLYIYGSNSKDQFTTIYGTDDIKINYDTINTDTGKTIENSLVLNAADFAKAGVLNAQGKRLLDQLSNKYVVAAENTDIFSFNTTESGSTLYYGVKYLDSSNDTSTISGKGIALPIVNSNYAGLLDSNNFNIFKTAVGDVNNLKENSSKYSNKILQLNAESTSSEIFEAFKNEQGNFVLPRVGFRVQNIVNEVEQADLLIVYVISTYKDVQNQFLIGIIDNSSNEPVITELVVILETSNNKFISKTTKKLLSKSDFSGDGDLFILGEGDPFMAETLDDGIHINYSYRNIDMEGDENNIHIPIATSDKVGLLSKEDKSRIDTIYEGNKAVVTPVITGSWTFYNQSNEEVSPESIDPIPNLVNPVIERGYSAIFKGTYKWTHTDNLKDPTQVESGSFWTTLTESNVNSSEVTSDKLTNNKTLQIGLQAPKTGLMVSGSSVVPASGMDTSRASVSITFKDRVFWGHLDEKYVDESSLAGLNTELQNSNDKTVTVTTNQNQYFVYAFPQSLGNISSIIMDNTTQVIGAFTKGTFNITNAAGLQVAMYYYISNNPGAFNNNKLTIL